jgi:5'-nucleotidase (lipoprotein e(P4) family)
MIPRSRLGGVVLAATLITSCAGQQPALSTGPSTPSSAAASVRETDERLNGVLWMQTAPEYWALAEAAYDRASLTLDRALADKTWTAALEQESAGNFAALPPAVILDLDETVLDNSQFHGQLIIDHGDFSPATWGAWSEKGAAHAIPGAIAFINAARAKGVRVLFVTNRTIDEKPATVKNLDALLASPTRPDDVMCIGENQWTADKSSRRKFVAEKYRILLLFGDDLNDFISVNSTATPAQRVAVAQENAMRWRDRWVLLPNPIYGSWERALYRGFTNDQEILKRKHDTVRGYKQ